MGNWWNPIFEFPRIETRSSARVRSKQLTPYAIEMTTEVDSAHQDFDEAVADLW
jgi:hypothetical protein